VYGKKTEVQNRNVTETLRARIGIVEQATRKMNCDLRKFY